MMQPLAPEISIVAPAYNEQDSVDAFYDRVSHVLKQAGVTSEIIFINDGSTDSTLEKMIALSERDARVVVIDLSRNFGKEIALTAGLDIVRGQAAIPIDVDLQDPPELIPALIAKWRAGFQVVNARRRNRKGETVMKKATASAFYKLMNQLHRQSALPANVGDFRLLDRKALDAVSTMRERHRFMKGLFTVVGFRQAFVEYDRDPRYGGRTSFNYWKLWNFSLEGITSFTTLPLRLSGYAGLMVAMLSFAYGMYVLVKALFLGDPVAGFPTLFVTITFIGGVQLLCLGVIGEYLGRIFNETKNRPLYFINDIYAQPMAASESAAKPGAAAANS
jgi:glycosyltransferase involved in cell wall biosynthesis